MVKIIAVSDSHGNFKGLKALEKYFNECDYIFHLGDYYGDMDFFRLKYGRKIFAVKGNCDGGGEERVIDINGFKILLVHGDRYRVKLSLTRLMLRAAELGVNAVFFGHTHSAVIEKEQGITFINPGAMSRFSKKTYCLAEIDNGEIKAGLFEFNL